VAGNEAIVRDIPAIGLSWLRRHGDAAIMPCLSEEASQSYDGAGQMIEIQ
jgi:hypothetical protein